MNKITSFTVDHDTITPGFYISRIDGDVITFDLRTRTPNAGDYMDNLTMHSVEHMLATLLRNSADSERVIYFGPMGCQTGFYFLFDSRLLTDAEAIGLLQQVFAAAAAFDDAMPGSSAIECGNFANLSVKEGRRICAFYTGVIENWTVERLQYA